ncbi:MAG: hypothetical protein HFJ46_07925 [Clostridia bacterium]|nr:hypothetical protein [Clostridia bacterium]
MENKKPFYVILDEICKEKNIKQELLSYGWIRKLEKENKIHYLMRYEFDLNSSISHNIAGDKYATYDVLNDKGIPTIPHKIIFNPITRSGYYNKNFFNEIENILEKYDNKVVVKANDSYKGKDVFYCSTKEEVEEVIEKLFNEKNDTLSICPYLDIDFEYRAIYLCGEIIYIYKKKKPYVIGDGVKTIKQLISERKEPEVPIDLNRGLNLSYIPKKDEEVTISWKHNLSGGAEPILVDETDEFSDRIKDIAKKAGDSINITFASVDVALTNKKEIVVMEINASVCMNKFSEVFENGKGIAKDIYSKAIDKMFDNY